MLVMGSPTPMRRKAGRGPVVGEGMIEMGPPDSHVRPTTHPNCNKQTCLLSYNVCLFCGCFAPCPVVVVTLALFIIYLPAENNLWYIPRLEFGFFFVFLLFLLVYSVVYSIVYLCC